jgi:hypothetical protein
LLASRIDGGPHHPQPTELRALFEANGFTLREQHRVHRPAWTKIFSDLITVGSKHPAGLIGC